MYSPTTGCWATRSQRRYTRRVSWPRSAHRRQASMSLRRRRDIWDVVVVGGGIGGLTAAGYCARRGLPTALLEGGGILGGQVATVNPLDDWPATADVSGVELANGLREKLGNNSVELGYEAV